MGLLESMSHLKSLQQAQLQRIAAVCQDEMFQAGSTIVNPNSPGDKLYFVMKGERRGNDLDSFVLTSARDGLN